MALGPWITKDDRDAVDRVLCSGDLMSGQLVELLEEKLAVYFGKRCCVCVSSGTAALECAFVATGEGDEINPSGFVAILSAARAAGRRPVEGKCDFLPRTIMDCHKILDVGGVATDVLGVETYAYTRVHDCAHRFDKGAAHAEVSCFSFAPNKFLACGGGCLVTNDSVVSATARQYRNHGRDGGPEIFREGRNLRMGEINAALALSQLKRIDEILGRRKQVAEWYDEITGGKFAPTVASHFLYPWLRMDAPAPPGQRTRSDFRLFGTADEHDRRCWLMPVWPCMTKDEVAAECARG